jgi:dihydrodipicolinate synthase/N-acetylneuraminate lyase
MLPKTVEVLSEHNNIIGIKEAVNDSKRMNQLLNISLKKDGEFLIFSGDDESFLDLLILGGHGVISVAANVIPNIISQICSQFKINQDETIKLNNKYKNLYELLFIESNPVPVKWILYKIGLIQNSIRLPLIPLDKKYQENITSEMLKLGLL